LIISNGQFRKLCKCYWSQNPGLQS
jgi:hypothetical protein